MSDFGMIGYDAWKTTPPVSWERDDSPRCLKSGCTDEAEYDGRCEFHFAEWQQEQFLESEPAIEWGNLEEIMDHGLDIKQTKQPTPKWRVGANTSRGWIIYEVPTERHVAYVVDCPSGSEFSGQESAKHARLIAAAPGLEKAIRDALETANGRWCEWGGRAESVRNILLDALRKLKKI